MHELKERVQCLPQELQDHILDFTLDTGSGDIDLAERRKPWQLHINRATRKRVAAAFFQDHAFVSYEGVCRPKSAERNVETTRVWLWLRSVDVAHQQLIKHARFHFDWSLVRKVDLLNVNEDFPSLARLVVALSNIQALSASSALPGRIFQINVEVKQEGGLFEEQWRSREEVLSLIAQNRRQ